MRILVAMDSFKGCISSEKAGDAVRRGILKAYPDNEVIVKAVSDGGEGMSETLIGALDCSVVHTTVSDPLQRQTDVSYGFLCGKETGSHGNGFCRGHHVAE